MKEDTQIDLMTKTFSIASQYYDLIRRMEFICSLSETVYRPTALIIPSDSGLFPKIQFESLGDENDSAEVSFAGHVLSYDALLKHLADNNLYPLHPSFTAALFSGDDGDSDDHEPEEKEALTLAELIAIITSKG